MWLPFVSLDSHFDDIMIEILTEKELKEFLHCSDSSIIDFHRKIPFRSVLQKIKTAGRSQPPLKMVRCECTYNKK